MLFKVERTLRKKITNSFRISDSIVLENIDKGGGIFANYVLLSQLSRKQTSY